MRRFTTWRKTTVWRKTPELLVAAGVGLWAAVAADMASPTDLKTFYEIIVQVLPVFLVAFALEQSVTRAIGTESSFVNEAAARAESDFEATPEWERVHRAFANLHERYGSQAEEYVDELDENEREQLSIISDYGPAAQWHWLVTEFEKRATWHEGTEGTVEDEETAEPLLAVLAKLYEPQSAITVLYDDRRTFEDGFFKAHTLFESAVENALENEKRVARELARRHYRARVFGRRLAAFVAIALLAVTETIGLIGVLGDDPLRSTLFPLVAGATAAVIVVVSAGAMRDLASD